MGSNDICITRDRRSGLWSWAQGCLVDRWAELCLYADVEGEFEVMREDLHSALMNSRMTDAHRCARAIEGLSYRDGELQA